jgi:lipopolysaccharide exporter
MPSFLKNVFKISSGTILSQVIAMATMPILTRLFGAQAFGVSGLFYSTAIIFGDIAALRYELAILLPKEDDKAKSLFCLSVLIIFLTTVVLFLFITLFKENILVIFNLQELGDLIFLIPLMSFLIGLIAVLNRWFSRKKQFSKLGITQVVLKTTAQGSAIFAGTLGAINGIFLVLSKIFGYVCSCCFLGFRFLKKIRKKTGKLCDFKQIKEVAVRYKDFPKYNAWTSLLNTVSRQSPVILLGYFFTKEIVGFYSLGMQVLNLPMVFIGNAIGHVFFQRAAHLKHGGNLKEFYINIFKQLMSFGIFPFIILFFFGKNLFSFIFGSQWIEAGRYIQYLSLWIFLMFLTTPVNNLFSIFEKQNINLYRNIVFIILRIISLVIGGIFQNPLLAIILYSISGILYCLSSFIFINIWIKSSMFTLFRYTFYILIFNIPFILYFLLLLHLKRDGIILIVCLAPALLIYYLLLIIKNKNQIRKL